MKTHRANKSMFGIFKAGLVACGVSRFVLSLLPFVSRLVTSPASHWLFTNSSFHLSSAAQSAPYNRLGEGTLSYTPLKASSNRHTEVFHSSDASGLRSDVSVRGSGSLVVCCNPCKPCTWRTIWWLRTGFDDIGGYHSIVDEYESHQPTNVHCIQKGAYNPSTAYTVCLLNPLHIYIPVHKYRNVTSLRL